MELIWIPSPDMYHTISRAAFQFPTATSIFIGQCEYFYLYTQLLIVSARTNSLPQHKRHHTLTRHAVQFQQSCSSIPRYMSIAIPPFFFKKHDRFTGLVLPDSVAYQIPSLSSGVAFQMLAASSSSHDNGTRLGQRKGDAKAKPKYRGSTRAG